MDLSTIITWFKKGCKPTASQFEAVFRSFFHKDEKIPQSSVNGLSAALAAKAATKHTHELSDITDLSVFEQDISNQLSNKATKDHTHSFADVHGLDEALNNRPHAYTLDFGTGGEMVQDVAVLGAGTIVKVITRNVARLFVTNSSNVRTEITSSEPSISVADGDVLTWEIQRTTDDELACVGVKFQLNATE